MNIIDHIRRSCYELLRDQDRQADALRMSPDRWCEVMRDMTLDLVPRWTHPRGYQELMGMKVIVDRNMPTTEIEMHLHGKVISRIVLD